MSAMIHVCCSGRTETLLQAFVRGSASGRARVAPVRVVVSNHNMETHLGLGVARRRY
jgi:hypothetical protein